MEPSCKQVSLLQLSSGDFSILESTKLRSSQGVICKNSMFQMQVILVCTAQMTPSNATYKYTNNFIQYSLSRRMYLYSKKGNFLGFNWHFYYRVVLSAPLLFSVQSLEMIIRLFVLQKKISKNSSSMFSVSESTKHYSRPYLR